MNKVVKKLDLCLCIFSQHWAALYCSHRNFLTCTFHESTIGAVEIIHAWSMMDSCHSYGMCTPHELNWHGGAILNIKWWYATNSVPACRCSGYGSFAFADFFSLGFGATSQILIHHVQIASNMCTRWFILVGFCTMSDRYCELRIIHTFSFQRWNVKMHLRKKESVKERVTVC